MTKETFNSNHIKHLIITFIIAFLLHSISYVLDLVGYGTSVLMYLPSLPLAVLAAFSAPAMLFCLWKTPYTQRTPLHYKYILSLSFSLSSYIIVQGTSYKSVLIYVLTPILFILFTQLLSTNIGLPFIIVFGVMLCTDPISSLSIIILFTISYFLLYQDNTHTRLADFIHILSYIVFAFLFSAFASLPNIVKHFISAKQIGYPGFTFNMPLNVFLTRFSFGSISSTMLCQTNGLNLYIGIFAFIGLITYFCNNTISKESRIRTLIFLCICVSTILFSSFQYVLELFTSSNTTFVCNAVVLLFFCFLKSAEGLNNINVLSKRNLFFIVTVFLLQLGNTIIGFSHNFHALAFSTCSVFSLVYFAYLVLEHKGRQSTSLQIMVVCFTAVELTFNLLLVSYYDFAPSTPHLESNYASIIDSFYTKEQTLESNVESATPKINADVEDFLSNCFDSETAATLYSFIELSEKNGITTTKDITSDDPNKFGDKNIFEQINQLGKHYGFNDIFTPIDEVVYNFAKSNDYYVVNQGSNVFFIDGITTTSATENTYIPCTINSNTNDFYCYYDYSRAIYHFDTPDPINEYKAFFLLPVSNSIGYNFKIYAYTRNEANYQKLCDFVSENSSKQTNISMNYYYFGMLFSCCTVFFILLFVMYKNKSAYYQKIEEIKNHLSNLHLWNSFVSFICNKKLYILSFSIPCCIYLATLLIFDIAPFGSNSILAGDGLLSTYAGTYDFISQFRIGNTSFSMNGGYGYSIFPSSPNSLLLALTIPEKYLSIAINVILLLCYGFASLFTTIYLTHRHTATPSDRNNPLILGAGLIYSLNTYMLVMHAYFQWYPLFALLPLLLLAFERLVYKQKWGMYLILLSFCMCNDVQISYHFCFFLAITFLLLPFENLKDFLQKSLRFALFSVWAAINSILYLSSLFLSRSGSGYESEDSVFPSWGLFGSFLTEWKQHMIFSFVNPVSKNDNNISLYLSILCLMLLIAFAFSKSIKASEKVRRIAPVVLLYISFNERIMTYVINGFHYQSNVSNRHAYLLLFLLSILAFDTLKSIQTSTRFANILIASIISIAFFTVCFFAEENVSIATFACSILLVVLYTILLLVYTKKHFHFEKFILFVLLIELFSNAIFITAQYPMSDFAIIGDQQSLTEYTCANEDAYYSAFPGTQIINNGMLFQSKATDYFAPYTSNAKINYQLLYGGFCGTNFLSNIHGSTYANNTLFSVKNIYVSKYSNVAVPDLSQYRYVGLLNDYYVYENLDAVSLGYYASPKVKNLEADSYCHNNINQLVEALIDSEEPLYFQYYLENQSIASGDYGTYHFESYEGKPIDIEETFNIAEKNQSVSMFSKDYKLVLDFTPSNSGFSYLYASELIPLGNLTEGRSNNALIFGPKLVEPNYYQYVTVNSAVYKQLCDYLHSNELENVSISNNVVKAEANCEDDGYIIMNIPFDEKWSIYVDGQKVDSHSILDSYLSFEITSGHHEISLIYESNNTPFILISLMGWSLSLLALIASLLIQSKKAKIISVDSIDSFDSKNSSTICE